MLYDKKDLLDKNFYNNYMKLSDITSTTRAYEKTSKEIKLANAIFYNTLLIKEERSTRVVIKL